MSDTDSQVNESESEPDLKEIPQEISMPVILPKNSSVKNKRKYTISEKTKKHSSATSARMRLLNEENQRKLKEYELLMKKRTIKG